MSYSSNGPNNIVEDFSLLFLNVVYYILIEGYCKKKKKRRLHEIKNTCAHTPNGDWQLIEC